MKLPTLSLMFPLVLFVETSYSQQTNQWGEPVLGAQLSIAVTNDVIRAGTNTTIQCQIKNLSGSRISLDYPLMLPDDTHLFLINSAGKSSELTPNRIAGSALIGPTVKAGETYQWEKPLEISTNIEAGKYKLKATRYIHSANGTNYQGGKLVSNLLEVRVK